MIVAIHQPNFLPWSGFFHKLFSVQTFILLDNVPFTKNGYQNRVKIKTAQGDQWLTVPVLTRGRFGQLTHQVEIDTSKRWERVHLRTLRTNYHRAPYYDQVMACLKQYYQKSQTKLADFNMTLIKAIVDYLEVSTELVLASTLVEEKSGPELLLNLVEAVSGNVYLSGASGRDYLDVSNFECRGVDVRFQEFQHPIYPQLYGDFIPGLSIIDMLMNVDPSEARAYLWPKSVGNSDRETEAAVTHQGMKVKKAQTW